MYVNTIVKEKQRAEAWGLSGFQNAGKFSIFNVQRSIFMVRHLIGI
jgi:hypothetical protein